MTSEALKKTGHWVKLKIKQQTMNDGSKRVSADILDSETVPNGYERCCSCCYQINNSHFITDRHQTWARIFIFAPCRIFKLS